MVGSALRPNLNTASVCNTVCNGFHDRYDYGLIMQIPRFMWVEHAGHVEVNLNSVLVISADSQ